VLSATGLQDLLDKLSFMQRVRRQDVHIIKQVRTAQQAVVAEATRLGELEGRQQGLVGAVRAEGDRLASTNAGLQQQRAAVARFREAKASQRASARAQVAHLQTQLSQLQAAQAALAARAAAEAAAASSRPSAAFGGGGSATAPAASGPVTSAGGFVFSLPKCAAAPPGDWSPDQGVDISAPGRSPRVRGPLRHDRAARHRRLRTLGPLLHCDGSIDGYDYVYYYGHAGLLNQLPIGTHVGAGQIVSSVGPGIVGISIGPHLEIGFAESSGSQTAGTMLSLLQAAYNG
jgi:hypothetical protein